MASPYRYADLVEEEEGEEIDDDLEIHCSHCNAKGDDIGLCESSHWICTMCVENDLCPCCNLHVEGLLDSCFQHCYPPVRQHPKHIRGGLCAFESGKEDRQIECIDDWKPGCDICESLGKREKRAVVRFPHCMVEMVAGIGTSVVVYLLLITRNLSLVMDDIPPINVFLPEKLPRLLGRWTRAVVSTMREDAFSDPLDMESRVAPGQYLRPCALKHMLRANMDSAKFWDMRYIQPAPSMGFSATEIEEKTMHRTACGVGVFTRIYVFTIVPAASVVQFGMRFSRDGTLRYICLNCMREYESLDCIARECMATNADCLMKAKQTIFRVSK